MFQILKGEEATQEEEIPKNNEEIGNNNEEVKYNSKCQGYKYS